MGASKMAPFFSGHTGAMPVEYYRVQHDRVMRQYEILDFFLLQLHLQQNTLILH